MSSFGSLVAEIVKTCGIDSVVRNASIALRRIVHKRNDWMGVNFVFAHQNEQLFL